MSCWYAVFTHPREESVAKGHLERQGYSVYLPRYLKRRSHARRVTWAPMPLFPRYLFVEADPDTTPWRAMRSTVGVQDIVCASGRPAQVAPSIIDAIRAREDERQFVIINTVSQFCRGDKVRVLYGPLADQEGLFESNSDAARVVVLMRLLGRDVRVAVPPDAVSRCA